MTARKLAPHFGHAHGRQLDVILQRLITAACEHLGRNLAPEVGYFLGSLVDEQDDHAGIRRVGEDRGRELLQQLGLAGFGGRDDKPARAASDGCEEIDDARRYVPIGAQAETPVRIRGRQLGERSALAEGLRRHATDQFDIVQPQALPLRFGGAGNEGARDQLEAVDQGRGNEDILPGWREGARGVAEKAAAPLEYFEDSGNCHGGPTSRRGTYYSFSGAMNSASLSMTLPSTCPGLSYSEGPGFPLPAIKRWFRPVRITVSTFGRPAKPFRHAATSSSMI